MLTAQSESRGLIIAAKAAEIERASKETANLASELAHQDTRAYEIRGTSGSGLRVLSSESRGRCI
jgi:hypothetical protein